MKYTHRHNDRTNEFNKDPVYKVSTQKSALYDFAVN